MNIEFVDPPADGRGRPAYVRPFIEELRRINRADWALLRAGLKTANQPYKLKKLYDDCEFVSRRMNDGTYSVFVRLIKPFGTTTSRVTPVHSFDPDTDEREFTINQERVANGN